MSKKYLFILYEKNSRNRLFRPLRYNYNKYGTAREVGDIMDDLIQHNAGFQFFLIITNRGT